MRSLLATSTIRYLDERFPDAYADAAVHVGKDGFTIPAVDLMIAVAAILDEAILISRNRKHFGRVPGLNLRS